MFFFSYLGHSGQNRNSGKCWKELATLTCMALCLVYAYLGAGRGSSIPDSDSLPSSQPSGTRARSTSVSTLQRRSDLCIPINQTARPVPISIHSPIFLHQNRETDRWNICINRSKIQYMNERNWDWAAHFPYWEKFFPNFRYSIFCSAVRDPGTGSWSLAVSRSRRRRLQRQAVTSFPAAVPEGETAAVPGRKPRRSEMQKDSEQLRKLKALFFFRIYASSVYKILEKW